MLNKQPTPMSKPSSSTPRKDTNKNRAKKSNGSQKAGSLTLNPNAAARNSIMRAPDAERRESPQNAPHTEPKKQNQSHPINTPRSSARGRSEERRVGKECSAQGA